MMTLYGYWRSSASYRVRIALNLKGITVKHVSVDLRAGAQYADVHSTRNPQNYVPVLELKDGTILTQSIAIIEYLEAKTPTPSLLPDTLQAQAKVRAAALAIAADIAPIQNLSVQQYIRREYGQDADGATAWARHWIERGFAALETQIADHDQDYYLMDRPGYFECCLVPQVYNAERFGVDMRAYPNLQALNERAKRDPAFIAAAPQNQPDAP